MIEFSYKTIEHYLKQIENSLSVKVFQQSRRLVREKPVWDFIKANVTENNPYCLISISDYKESAMGFLFDTYVDYSVSDITHTGTSAATYQITGSHKGNNSYILKITTEGTIGTAPYPQYSLQVNGGNWSAVAEIPADGKISIGDGTTFEFEVGGVVILDETYAWQTIAKRINVTKDKEIQVGIRIEIWAKTKKELFETGGYYKQLSAQLTERYVTDGEQVIQQMPGSSRFFQSDFEKQNNIVRGVQTIIYNGATYTTKEDALVCEFKIEGG